MRKVTVRASADVALTKYWGKKDEVLRLPENGSVSMILEGLDTVTTVEFDEGLRGDEITIEGMRDESEVQRVSAHLDRIRQIAHVLLKARVVSQNTFPKGTGLSSSGSGFAALTIAATRALELDLSQKELSILARQGSGTACRCICGGFVEWKDGNTSETSYSKSIFPADYWDIRDVVVVVDEGKKRFSSTEGHKAAQSSVFFQVRQEHIAEKIRWLKQTLKKREFSSLGRLVEAESLEFHSILLTSVPPLLAWYPGTVQVMLEVERLRSGGVPAYFTISTGFNVHVLTLPEYERRVQKALSLLPLVQKTIVARVGGEPNELMEHLF